MNKPNKEDIKRVISMIIQPLSRGEYDSVSGISAKLKNLIPFGSFDRVQHTSPFGFISKPIAGVLAYYLNLHGNATAPTILGHLHNNRPEPTNPGETIIYCTDSTGTTFPIKLTLQGNGNLKAECIGEYQIAATKVRLGKLTAANPLVLGNETKALLSTLIQKVSDLTDAVANHKHIGNLGYPTAVPINVSTFNTLKSNFDTLKASPVDDSGILSTISFTEKS